MPVLKLIVSQQVFGRGGTKRVGSRVTGRVRMPAFDVPGFIWKTQAASRQPRYAQSSVRQSGRLLAAPAFVRPCGTAWPSGRYFVPARRSATCRPPSASAPRRLWPSAKWTVVHATTASSWRPPQHKGFSPSERFVMTLVNWCRWIDGHSV